MITVKNFEKIEKIGLQCKLKEDFACETRTYSALKRLLDIFIALVGMLFFVPLGILTALAIKLDDPKGPVLFIQTRIGKNGKPFSMYKFRSMVTNAEELLEELKDKNELSGPVFKMKEDPRITKIGRFIRKTSIDEIPQLMNVLMGDMSIVGPRPPLPREVEQYNEFQMQRLCVKPGLTCYWQISGRDKISDFDERVELDLRYIRERTLWVDILIIFKTIPAILSSKDAT